MRIENASFVTQAKQCCVVLCKPNKLYTIGNVMSLAKMLFSHHLNNMPFVGSFMSCSYTELIKFKKCTDGGSTFSLQLRYEYWSETVLLGRIVFQRPDTKK